MSLSGKVAIVTGASRGIGRGIALQLGASGAKVYITGRKPEQSQNSEFGLSSLEQTAKDITDRGGQGVAVFVDHTNMDEVRDLFDHVSKENGGQLDILVNNAYQAVKAISDNIGKKFYEYGPEMWDTVNNVGLRNHYYCSVYAARLMVEKRDGLIINVSSFGGLRYLFNAAYGAGKQALDRLAEDMAIELKESNVTVVSLWPGAVRTELIQDMLAKKDGGLTKTAKSAEMFANGETVEYPGLAVASLAADPHKISKTGRILITADLGNEYGFVDIDGRIPPNVRTIKTLLQSAGWKQTAEWIPHWVRLPGWVLWASTSRL